MVQTKFETKVLQLSRLRLKGKLLHNLCFIDPRIKLPNKHKLQTTGACKKQTDLVLDGGGVQHGDIVHGDALPDDPLAPPLELQLAVAVGEVQQPDGVLGREVHGVGVEVEEEGAVHGVAEVADVDAALHTPLLPVVLAER